MRTVIRGYRIRAYPNCAQERLISRHLGAVHWLWNSSLDIRSELYRLFKMSMSGNDVSSWLTQWKRTAGHEWLAEVPATCLAQCLRDRDRAFSNFFAKRARYPRRRKKAYGGTLRFQDIGTAWTRGGLKLPKLGRLKLAETLPEVAKPDMVTLTREAAGRYFVSFKAEIAMEALPAIGKSVGVDLGLTQLATLSSGERIAAPKKYVGRLRYLRRRQLRYKADWYGRKLIEVDRFFPSSKRCSKCGHVLDELRLDQRSWLCLKCGMEHDRDLNAARNLEAEGLRLCLAQGLLAGGDRRRTCVDGRGSWQDASSDQVLPVEARSGQLAVAGTEPAAAT